MSSKGAQIFITKLPKDIRAEEIRREFQRFGKIVDVSIKRGYAFVVSFVFF